MDSDLHGSQCFHHGDWHTENLLLSEDGRLSVIDWELLDYDNYGDPWEEFNRINNAVRLWRRRAFRKKENE